MLVCSLLLSGCASKVGWSVTEQRTCSPKDPAQVCSRVAPDYGHVIEIGDVELLPGECVALGAQGRAGLTRIETRDPRGQTRRRSVRVPKSKVTILAVEANGRVDVVERRACDRTPISLE